MLVPDAASFALLKRSGYSTVCCFMLDFELSKLRLYQALLGQF